MSDLPRYPSYPGDDGPSQSWSPLQGPEAVPPGANLRPEFAGWWSRVGAVLLDGLFAVAVGIVPVIVGAVIAFKDAELDPVTDEITGGVDGSGVLLMILGGVLYFAADIWNRVVRLGATGQSLGKKAAGIRVVKAEHGDVIGGGAALGRWGIQVVFGFVPLALLTLLDVLWPLWDERHQALHDKVVGSVVVPA